MYQKPKSNTVCSKQLFTCCVLIPIFLAVTAIFSTCISQTTQNHIIFGIPLVLWFWFAVAMVTCVLSMIAGFSVIKMLDDTDNQ